MQYKALRNRASNEKVWAIKPKMHLLQEMAEYMTEEVGNLRARWCYKDEDFVGFASSLAMSRGGGKQACTAPLRTLNRWRALCA